MCLQYRNLLSLCLVFLWPAAGLSCDRHSMLVCLYKDELKKDSFSILFTQTFTDFKKTCREQDIFLKCAFMPIQNVGCSRGNLLDVYALRNVHQAVCGVNTMPAYYRSRPCILLLQADVEKCYQPIWITKDDHCGELMGVRECIQEVVKQKPECSSEDLIFVQKVIDSSLKPYAHREVHNCDMAIFGDEDETTTQAEPVTSTIYAAEKNKMLTETLESTANANMSTKVETPGESLASTGENSSNRRFLSAGAVLFTILAWLSVRSLGVY